MCYLNNGWLLYPSLQFPALSKKPCGRVRCTGWMVSRLTKAVPEAVTIKERLALAVNERIE